MKCLALQAQIFNLIEDFEQRDNAIVNCRHLLKKQTGKLPDLPSWESMVSS